MSDSDIKQRIITINDNPLFIISPIISHLFITNWPSSENLELLKQYDIKAVLTIEIQSRSAEALNTYRQLGIDYRQVPVDDIPSENLGRFFDQTSHFINHHVSKGENTIVNCMAGISRSVTIVTNYMLKLLYEQSGQSPEPSDAIEATLRYIRRTRPWAQPNKGFMSQLELAASAYKKACGRNGNISEFSPKTLFKEDNGITKTNMCDESWTDSNGKPANIICLTTNDFDAQGNLLNFKTVNGVIMWFSPACGHCVHMKPAYATFANMLGSAQIRAFAVDTSKQRDLMAKVDPKIWGYSIMGVPAVVGYTNGKFYSEYGMDDPKKFRSDEDLLEYALGIGKAKIETIHAR